MRQGYTAYVLTETARCALLEVFPPGCSKVVAHHVTHAFDVDASKVPDEPERVCVVGIHSFKDIQVAIVEIDGRRFQESRGDGILRYYHITLSLNPESGIQPSHSNDKISELVRAKGENALKNLPAPFLLDVVPIFIERSKRCTPTGGGTRPTLKQG